MCGRFCGLLSPLLSFHAPQAASVFGCHGDVCPASPFSPRRPCPPRWCVPSWTVPWSRREGQWRGQAWPWLVATNTVSGQHALSGLSEGTLAPVCGFRGGMGRKKRCPGLGSSGILVGTFQKNCAGQRKQGSVSPSRAASGPKCKVLFTL